MSFNPDLNKQAQEVLFSQKKKKLSQPSLIFNNNSVTYSEIFKECGFPGTSQEHIQ